jgi:hypothetical protein
MHWLKTLKNSSRLLTAKSGELFALWSNAPSKAGELREDLDAIDLLRALVGVANLATSPDWQQSARFSTNLTVPAHSIWN